MRQAPRDRRDGPNPPGRFDRLRGAGPPAARATEPVVQDLPEPRAVAQRWHDDTLSKTRTVVPEAPHTLATWTAAWLPDSHMTPGAQR